MHAVRPGPEPSDVSDPTHERERDKRQYDRGRLRHPLTPFERDPESVNVERTGGDDRRGRAGEMDGDDLRLEAHRLRSGERSKRGDLDGRRLEVRFVLSGRFCAWNRRHDVRSRENARRGGHAQASVAGPPRGSRDLSAANAGVGLPRRLRGLAGRRDGGGEGRDT